MVCNANYLIDNYNLVMKIRVKYKKIKKINKKELYLLFTTD